jgi:hypothetical protein
MGKFVEAHTEGRGRSKNEAVRDAFWARIKINENWSDAEIERIEFSANENSGHIYFRKNGEENLESAEFTIQEQATGDWKSKLEAP